MKCGARVALGVAGGYFLGRTKKMKLALMLAGMAAGRQAGGPGALLSQGRSLLGASPELSRLSDDLRGRLLDAGKGAALAIATRQVETLTDRVAGRVEKSLSGVGGRQRPTSDRDEDDRRADDEYDDEVEDVDDAGGTDDAGAAEDEGESAEEPAAVGGRTRSGRGSGSRTEGGTRRRAQSASGAAKGAARTTARRASSATSRTRSNGEKAAARPTRARRNGDG